MITFDSGGGLGNRIFQYVAARLLAEKLGFNLESPCTVANVLTPTIPAPGERHSDHRTDIIETLDTEDILKTDYGNRHIHLQGYWQIPHYYIDNRDKVVGYFEEKGLGPDGTDKENIVMHVRLGDYKIYGPKGNVLNPKYYVDCLSREKFNRLFVVTDEPDDEYFSVFERYRPIFSRGSIKKDFWFLTEFDRIIIGNSSFSWWAAFLSNASKIYTPKCWIRNSNDISHELQIINNGRCDGIQMEADFIDYNVDPKDVFYHE